ncbi:predicted protein [Streptomyces sp. AA4]|nr:predicted protein [Streptomyces sp. AA4]
MHRVARGGLNPGFARRLSGAVTVADVHCALRVAGRLGGTVGTGRPGERFALGVCSPALPSGSGGIPEFLSRQETDAW